MKKPPVSSSLSEEHRHPTTPDGRYFVVRERLWRCSNPALSPQLREQLVHALMAARRAKGAAMRAHDGDAREQARRAVDEAKHQLGERGAVWWTDGAPDENRHLVRNTAYAAWYAQLTETAAKTATGTATRTATGTATKPAAGTATKTAAESATTIPSKTAPRAKANVTPPLL